MYLSSRKRMLSALYFGKEIELLRNALTIFSYILFVCKTIWHRQLGYKFTKDMILFLWKNQLAF